MINSIGDIFALVSLFITQCCNIFLLNNLLKELKRVVATLKSKFVSHFSFGKIKFGAREISDASNFVGKRQASSTLIYQFKKLVFVIMS